MQEKYYFVSAPFEEKSSGDRDYVEVLVSALNSQQMVQAEYLTGEKCDYALPLISLEKLCENRNNSSEFANSLALARDDSDRENIVKKIIAKILADAKEKNVVPRLMLQLRPPETGAVFMPEDLKECKRLGIRVSVTCHEYKLNYNGRRYLQAYAQEYFAAADQVIFFNEKDANNAAKHASHEGFLQYGEREGAKTSLGHKKIANQNSDSKNDYKFSHSPFDLKVKSVLSRVPPTTAYKQVTFDEFQARSPGSIVFGLLRPGKGFDIALDLAKVLHTKKEASPALSKVVIIIAGKPSDYELVAKILNYQLNLDNKVKKIGEDEEKLKNEAVNKIVSILKDGSEYTAIQSEVDEGLKQDLKITSGPRDKYLEKKEKLIEKKLKSKAEEILQSTQDNVSGILAIKLEYTEASEKLEREKIALEEQRFTPEKVETMVDSGVFYNRSFAEDHGYPLEVYFDVPTTNMPDIFAKAKYAVKIDEKGWANNASGHISAVANGCILYTSWGMNTPDEVLPERTKIRPGGELVVTPAGEYFGAVVLPEHKYSLAKGQHHEDGEKKKHYHSKISDHKDYITADKILEDIGRRERDPELNRETFLIAHEMMKLFQPEVIAKKLVGDLRVQEAGVNRSKMVAKLRERVKLKPEEIEKVPGTDLEDFDKAFPIKRSHVEEYERGVALIKRTLPSPPTGTKPPSGWPTR